MEAAKAISANAQIEKLNHEKMHVEILIKQFPDLQIYQDNNTINFYASSINSQADAVSFQDVNMSGYNHFHYACPYKEIQIGCRHCDGKVIMNTFPSRFLIFTYYGSDYFTGEQYMYASVYEDICKKNKISQDIIGKCHIYTLQFLSILSSKKLKLTERCLNNSCEKLLPFM